jgi:hypothetical protein
MPISLSVIFCQAIKDCYFGEDRFEVTTQFFCVGGDVPKLVVHVVAVKFEYLPSDSKKQ